MTSASGPPQGADPERPRAGWAGYLFGLTAVMLAAAVLVAVLRRPGTVSATAEPSPAPSPTSFAFAAVPSPAVRAGLTPSEQSYRGPREAADASVGAPRWNDRAAASGSAPSHPAAGREIALAAPESPEVSVTGAPAPDKTFQTRRFAKFSVSPDQARIFLDGRFVGVADDWDDHGGGRTLEVGREGRHRVRLELPGYRTMRLEIVVTPAAKDETVDIGDDLKSESRVPFPKIPKVDDRTVGPIEFERVEPAEMMVLEDGRALGPASGFGPGSPLQLTGPMAHELVLSAPGYKSKAIRILVASNAGRDVAKVKVSLKKE